MSYKWNYGICSLWDLAVFSQHNASEICLYCISSVQSLTCSRLLATPWTAAHQASLSITNSRSLLKLMSVESVMPSTHLILCHPLLLLPSIFPSLKVFPNESALHIISVDHSFVLMNRIHLLMNI